jgi:riboflavin kinase / FMN adenylyltransferase
VKGAAVLDVWRSPEEIDADLAATVVTVGNFDGVHLGHRRVLSRATEIADELGHPPVVVVTFDPHPMAVLRPDRAPLMLTTPDQRAELLAEAGADAMLVVSFDEEIAHWSPEDFVRRILVDALHAAVVVVGANFRFGHRAAGDVTLLSRLGKEYGFSCESLSLEDEPVAWSSSYVRARIAEGDVAAAAVALGRPVFVEGVVVRGERRGRALGYPTANVPAPEHSAVPADGVYAGWLQRLDDPDRQPLPAAISVGTNPTFDGRLRQVEAYVLDRTDLELYDVGVRVGFERRLRGMERFDSIEELKAAMGRDVALAHEVLGVPVPDQHA